jgi:hypothetical protein
LGFPGGAAAVCERVRFLAGENDRLWEMTVGRFLAISTSTQQGKSMIIKFTR